MTDMQCQCPHYIWRFVSFASLSLKIVPVSTIEVNLALSHCTVIPIGGQIFSVMSH